MVFCNIKTKIGLTYRKVVTILILIDGFLQSSMLRGFGRPTMVTILILIDGFLQYDVSACSEELKKVTILILIDGFLQ